MARLNQITLQKILLIRFAVHYRRAQACFSLQVAYGHFLKKIYTEYYTLFVSVFFLTLHIYNYAFVKIKKYVVLG